MNENFKKDKRYPGIRINDYMNLKGIEGTRLIATKDIQQILRSKYQDLVKEIELVYNYYDKESNFVETILRVPSECSKNIQYTVIFKFLLKEDQSNLNGNTFMQMFSSSPNFQFTYAYVYRKYGLLYNKYEYLLNKKTSRRPRKRNPKELLGIDKSIAFGILYLQENSRGNITRTIGRKPKYIEPTDKITEQRNKTKCTSSNNHGYFTF